MCSNSSRGKAYFYNTLFELLGYSNSHFQAEINASRGRQGRYGGHEKAESLDRRQRRSHSHELESQGEKGPKHFGQAETEELNERNVEGRQRSLNAPNKSIQDDFHVGSAQLVDAR